MRTIIYILIALLNLYVSAKTDSVMLCLAGLLWIYTAYRTWGWEGGYYV